MHIEALVCEYCGEYHVGGDKCTEPDVHPVFILLHAPERYNPPTVSKDQASCCVSHRDAQGRLPVGFCGPDCERRLPVAS